MKTKAIPFEVTEEQRQRFQALFRSAREAQHKLQSQVSEESGLSQSFISSTENGPQGRQSLIETLRLARYYNISPQKLAEVLGIYEPTPEPAVPEHLLEYIDLLKQIPAEHLPQVKNLLKYYAKLPTF